MEFARSKSEARKEGLTGIEFSDVAGLGPILNEVVEVVEVSCLWVKGVGYLGDGDVAGLGPILDEVVEVVDKSVDQGALGTSRGWGPS